MHDDFVIARNPDDDSTLPYIVRIPLGDGILLKARDTWPRTAKVYCHRVEDWPEDAATVAGLADAAPLPPRDLTPTEKRQQPNG